VIAAWDIVATLTVRLPFATLHDLQGDGFFFPVLIVRPRFRRTRATAVQLVAKIERIFAMLGLGLLAGALPFDG